MIQALVLVGERHAANRKTLGTWLPTLPIFELPVLDPLTSEAIDVWLDAHPIQELLP